jgi:hypothetical protein
VDRDADGVAEAGRPDAAAEADGTTTLSSSSETRKGVGDGEGDCDGGAPGVSDAEGVLVGVRVCDELLVHEVEGVAEAPIEGDALGDG